jgi:hypothetical protein
MAIEICSLKTHGNFKKLWGGMGKKNSNFLNSLQPVGERQPCLCSHRNEHPILPIRSQKQMSVLRIGVVPDVIFTVG